MAKGQKTGGGSRRGVPNQLSGDVKAMILAALDAAGGAEYLLRQAKQNPVAFMSLLGKLLPTQLTGKDGGANLNAFDPRTLSDAELSAHIVSTMTDEELEARILALQEATKPPGAVH